MINRKIIAAVAGVAIGMALLCTGCSMAVNDPVREAPIFEPYISVQPASHTYIESEYTDPPELSIEVWDWDKLDGKLSFQWYRFSTMEKYYKNEAESIPDAIDMTYTPDPTEIEAEAGNQYYYYVEVTNTNRDAVGSRKEAAVKSDVAIISFSADGAPAIPIILQSPANATYTMGRSLTFAFLEVRTNIAEPEYQWFTFKLADGFTDGKPNGTKIEGADERTYMPVADDLKPGDNFYYVVITNVDGEQKAEQYSFPANVYMALGEKALAPRIDAQPQDITYFTGADLTAVGTAKLTVAAVAIDGGVLSYDWYSSDTAAGAGTKITGATEAIFLPDINTAAAGTKYYYVVITNTNQYVEGSQTETATSKRAAVKVRAAGTISANAIITVDPLEKYQYIRGYGGMETTWGNFFQSDPEDMENMFNPDKLGFNMWRIMIPPISTNPEDIRDYVMSRSYANRYYENVKIVNKYNGYVLASPWSPPKEWKSNNSINSGGHLMPRYYQEYANYLRSYAQHMAGNGAPIYAVSIANEPNYAGGYDGCEWEPEQMRDFFKQVGHFTQGVRGYGGGKAISSVLTVNGESANTPEINHAAMNDPVSNAAIDLFARHVYGEQRKVLWGNPNLNGREVWMTEHNINSASSTAFPNDWTWNYVWRFMNDVDLVIRLNNENAFVWWVVKRFYSFIGDGEANTSRHTILPRGWGLAHYSKFTIDTTRIGVNVTGTLQNGNPVSMGGNVNNNSFDLDNSSVRVTAFISQDGNEISLVLWTPTSTSGGGGYTLGNAEIQMPAGFKIRSATAMRSRAASAGGNTGVTTNMGQFEDVEIASNRESVYVNLPNSQILSVKLIKE